MDSQSKLERLSSPGWAVFVVTPETFDGGIMQDIAARLGDVAAPVGIASILIVPIQVHDGGFARLIVPSNFEAEEA